MTSWIHELRMADGEFALTVPLVIAVALLVILPFAVPPGKRLRVRSPLLAFCLSILFSVLLATLDEGNSTRTFYLFLSSLFLLLSIVRSVYILAARSRIAPDSIAQMPQIVLDVAQALFYFGAFVAALSVARVPFEVAETITKWAAFIAAFLAVLARHTIENIIAGLALQIQRPFEPDDWIQFDERPDNIGKVLEVNWRTTRVVTLDEVEVNIPNASLAQLPIRNYTKPKKYSRRSVYVVTPYNVPTQLASEIIRDAVTTAWGVEASPPPSVVTNAFTDRGVEHWVRIFTTEFDRRDKVDGAVRDRIWYALHRSGITIPGPLRQVELRDVGREAIDEEQQYLSDERKEALRRVAFLDELSEEQLSRIARTARLRHYAQDEIIIEQGSTDTDLFILKSGDVLMTYRHEDGTAAEVDQIRGTGFFGELGFLTGTPRTATVTAMTDTDVFVVDSETLHPILIEAPGLIDHMAELLYSRQALLCERMSEYRDALPVAIANDKHSLLRHIKAFFSL